MAATLWTYLLCVSTFGIYALAWVYRAARDVSGHDRATALACSLGFTAAPLACAFLHDVARSSEQRRPGAHYLVWLPPLLHAAIASVLFLSPLRTLWAPIWLLLPLPLLVIDHRARLVVRLGPHRRLLEIVTVSIGLPVVFLSTVFLDRPVAATLLAPALSGPVRGIRGSYELDAPAGWRRVPRGTFGDTTSDLELMSGDRSAWLIAYREQADRSIDNIVDARRTLISSEVVIRGLHDRRFFLRPDELLTASLARYQIGLNTLTAAEYLVLTARLEDEFIELVVYTANPQTHSDQILSLFASLRPSPDGRQQTAGDDR